MRQIIDIKVPTCWQQLSDKQLRFVFKLLNGNSRESREKKGRFLSFFRGASENACTNFSLPQVKALCLLKFASSENKDKSSWLCRVVSKFCGAKLAKMKILRREGSIFIMKYNKQTFPVTALQITEVTQSMEWLGDFPVYPVRLSRIGLHRPIPANFQGVPFGTFLALDNLYQGYLQTRKQDIAIDMARIMYQSKFQSSESKGKLAWLCRVVKKFCGAKHIHHLSKVEEINVFYWFKSVKRFFANMFTYFFYTSKRTCKKFFHISS